MKRLESRPVCQRCLTSMFHFVQLESLGLSFVSADELPSRLTDEYDLAVDAMFGFSFHGGWIAQNFYYSAYAVVSGMSKFLIASEGG